MESFGNNMMPVNFTISEQSRPSEPVILDLSCKKPKSRTSDSSVSCKSESTSLSSSEKQSEVEYPPRNYFEDLPSVVTPPSPAASPERTNYVLAYNCSNLAEGNMLGKLGGFPMLPMSAVVPTIPATVPALLPPNHGAQMNSTDVNSAESTTASSGAASQTNSGSSSPEMNKKSTRPFKAYPRDPLSLNVGDGRYNTGSKETYEEFRKRMLESVKHTNEEPNPKMRRVSKSPTEPSSPSDEKDAAYWERRRKNNQAAKRSRDARRAKEDELAIRTAFLEQETAKLQYEVETLQNEQAHLKCIMYRT